MAQLSLFILFRLPFFKQIRCLDLVYNYLIKVGNRSKSNRSNWRLNKMYS